MEAGGVPGRGPDAGPRTGAETSQHLFQPPAYGRADGGWTPHFVEAARSLKSAPTWDPAAVASILGLSFAVGDRTLLREVRRLPFLASSGNPPRLEPIPPHGFRGDPPGRAADRLLELLRAEALDAAAGRSEIYVLLSGGLDSRIGAGVLAQLYREGRLPARPIAVTWGSPESRDVRYGELAARILDLEWRHIPLGPEDVLNNLDAVATRLGGLIAPHHLHGMLWFADLPADALVFAASYGDSVGRAEFSSLHVLELSPLRPTGAFGLLRDDVLACAIEGMQRDLGALRQRARNAPEHAVCELEMQGHYMRGMIGQGMSVINHFCRVYQLFTHPRTYSYMWSIHPALRTDEIYAELLERLDPRLARMPWARTNEALRGVTEGAEATATSSYHDYPGWIRGPLFDGLRARVEPEWFEATGLFRADTIIAIEQAVRNGETRYGGTGRPAYEPWLWLATFRRFAEWLEERGCRPTLGPVHPPASGLDTEATKPRVGRVRQFLRGSPGLYRLVRRTRLRALKQEALKRYPVEPPDGESD